MVDKKDKSADSLSWWERTLGSLAVLSPVIGLFLAVLASSLLFGCKDANYIREDDRSLPVSPDSSQSSSGNTENSIRRDNNVYPEHNRWWEKQ